MFCIVCGKKAEIENFCKEHYAGRIRLFHVSDFSIDVCPECGKGMPTDDDITRSCRWLSKPAEVEMKRKTVGNRIVVDITAVGKVHHKVEKKESHRMAITLRRRKCDTCVKKSGGYYEAVIQVRGPSKDKILAILEKLLEYSDITSLQQNKDGYDVKLISKKKASTISKHLGKKFSVTKSHKLVGQKKGKMLYRTYHAVR